MGGGSHDEHGPYHEGYIDSLLWCMIYSSSICTYGSQTEEHEAYRISISILLNIVEQAGGNGSEVIDLCVRVL